MDIDVPALSQKERLTYAKEQTAATFRKVFPYILLSVVVGAVIHNWIPQKWIEMVLGTHNPFGVFLATVIGILMYTDIFGTISVAEALGKHLASEVFESYSAGTETKPQINQDAVRIMKQLYNIDMEQTQYSKLIAEIPEPDMAISMGCNVGWQYHKRH